MPRIMSRFDGEIPSLLIEQSRTRSFMISNLTRVGNPTAEKWVDSSY